MRGVVPHWSLMDIYRGMMQFMVVHLIGLALLVMFPSLVFFLPDLLRN